jgi:immunity protein 42 of polymorphic toxin system
VVVKELTTNSGRKAYEAVWDLVLKLGEWIDGSFVPFAEALADGGHIGEPVARRARRPGGHRDGRPLGVHLALHLARRRLVPGGLPSRRSRRQPSLRGRTSTRQPALEFLDTAGGRHMIIGDPKVFALESGISVAYPSLGQRGLGFFLIHVEGAGYGVRAPDATMLACSFDEVGRRLERRGSHSAPFSVGVDACQLAEAVRRALYFDVPPQERFFGMSQGDFAAHVYDKKLLWAPDGDEAFDDGSYVLQLDQEDQVRLIGFKSNEHQPYDSSTLREATLPAKTFYGVLQEWASVFEAEWMAMPKAPSAAVLE